MNIICLDCKKIFNTNDEVELIEKKGICLDCRDIRMEKAKKIDAQIISAPRVKIEIPTMDMKYDKDRFINARDLLGFYGKGFSGR